MPSNTAATTSTSPKATLPNAPDSADSNLAAKVTTTSRLSPSSRMKKLLEEAISRQASDLHLSIGVPPVLRIDGKLIGVAGESVITPEDAKKLAESLMTSQQIARLEQERELDFSFGYQAMRFRVNVFFERGSHACALRLIPKEIRDLSSLGLPDMLARLMNLNQGLILITGPTGHGKTTTAASMLQQVNTTRRSHIITVEDPIEYLFEHHKSIIQQREVGSDTLTFAKALRSALREDPNIVFLGEMRDFETIEAALTVAETGHLVIATLHTNTAAQTADRIIDAFPPHQQSQARTQLANSLLAIVSQRLLPKVAGGRIAAAEIMLATSAVRNIIREAKTHQLNNVIQTSGSEGMISLDKVLAELVSKGEITMDEALNWAYDQKAFKAMVY